MNDYLYIRAWQIFIHKEDTLGLEDRLQFARSSNAPENAVFYDDENSRWVTLDNITNQITLRELNKIYRQLVGLPPIKEPKFVSQAESLY